MEYIIVAVALAAIFGLCRKSRPKHRRESESYHETAYRSVDEGCQAEESDNEDIPGRVSSFKPYGISNEYYEFCRDRADSMFRYLNDTNNDEKFIEFLNGVAGLEVMDDTNLVRGLNNRLFILFLYDFIKVYNQLGHNLKSDNKEILTLGLLLSRLFDGGDVTGFDRMGDFYSRVMPSMIGIMESVAEFSGKQVEGKYEFYLTYLFEIYDKERLQYYKVMLYRFASLVAKADGVVNPEEAEYLAGLMSGTEVSVNKTTQTPVSLPVVASDSEQNPAKELERLIGLSSVKDEVVRLTNFIKIQQCREKEGLKAVPISYHCVFTGNPGTGKTTVARILAEIYKDLGLLAKGQLVETDRSGLVAEYVGQTAVKTNKIIDSALDGVLFIDEAYSLVAGGANDFGLEAIATLLKRMEDDRSRLVVVLAGYGDEMKTFIDANPGLQSRFNRYIHFSDYNAPELIEIFKLNASRHDYILAPGAEATLAGVIEHAVNNKNRNFGNARYVRNLFEKTLENQATRLASLGSITKELLQELTAADIPSSAPHES